VPCAAGTFCAGAGTTAASAALCPPGSYCPLGSSAATPCPGGSYNPVPGAAVAM
jgi:hypothetical protein